METWADRFRPDYTLLFVVSDVFLIVFAGHMAAYLTFGHSLDSTAPIHLMLVYFSAVLACVLFPHGDIYVSWRGRSMLAKFCRLAIVWISVLCVGVIISFLIHSAGVISRLWLACWYGLTLLLLLIYRALLQSVLKLCRVNGINVKRVVIVGYGRLGRDLHRRAIEKHWCGYEIEGIYDPISPHSPTIGSSIQLITTGESLLKFLSSNKVDEVWLTLPMSAHKELRRVQRCLRNSLVDIRWMPDVLSMRMLSCKMIDFLGIPAVDLNCPHLNALDILLKGLFDKMFSLCFLLWFSPIYLCIAIGVWLTSPGPIIYKQTRIGLNGKKFYIYKFRTMSTCDGDTRVVQAVKNDPRVTKFGAFLRKTSLDELPQFFNVLKGEMSVVGPRPHAVEHNEMYGRLLKVYMVRHRVKPGVTGWAQINGFRGETDTLEKMEKRVQSDLYYIYNWSFFLDLRIIFWTAMIGWRSELAY